MDTLATCPSCQLFGIFGQAGSTRNLGTSRADDDRPCAAALRAAPTHGPNPAIARAETTRLRMSRMGNSSRRGYSWTQPYSNDLTRLMRLASS